MLNEKEKIKLLKDTKKIFDKNNIEFFPIHGTLLALVREKRIFPWDEDIDIGAWYYDYNKIASLKKDFEKIGYTLTFGSGKYSHTNITPIKELNDKKRTKSVPFHVGIDFFAVDKDNIVLLKFFDENIFDKKFGIIEERLNKKQGSNISLRMYKLVKTIFYNVILYMRKHEVYQYSWFKKLIPLKVYDMDIKVSSNYENYLELTYGKSWRIPDKNWSYEKWMKVHKAFRRYKIKDNAIRDLWIKR